MRIDTESSRPLLPAISDPPFKVRDCLIGQNTIIEVFQGGDILFYTEIFLSLMLKDFKS